MAKAEFAGRSRETRSAKASIDDASRRGEFRNSHVDEASDQSQTPARIESASAKRGRGGGQAARATAVAHGEERPSMSQEIREAGSTFLIWLVEE